ncbi:unnamed protein product [Fusarium venenatum]|uniref:Uncharacterized protein n=1 Tax=Fusarium venenatum TaxID=56646 RepID=A0A2L2TZR6_9HYPO|nr:uncharacterized protein FVRRES_03307 [Fusarium venenatum]CEI66795.1 unnamed protein product [Fusarium venenatum]
MAISAVTEQTRNAPSLSQRKWSAAYSSQKKSPVCENTVMVSRGVEMMDRIPGKYDWDKQGVQGAGVGQTQPRYKTAVRIDDARLESEDPDECISVGRLYLWRKGLDCFVFTMFCFLIVVLSWAPMPFICIFIAV